MRALLLSLVLFQVAAPAFAQAPASETWYEIVDGAGVRLGRASTQIVPKRDGREIIQRQELYLAEQGGEPARMIEETTRREDASGQPISIRAISRGNQSVARTEVAFESGAARVTRTTRSGRSRDEVHLPDGVRFDGGDALLRAWNAAQTPRLEFDSFNLDALAIEHVVIEAAGVDGEGRTLALRTRYLHGALRGVSRLVIDQDGRTVEMIQPMLGATLHIRVTDRARAESAFAAYRVLPNVMTHSPFRISPDAAQGHIRYRFSFRDGLVFNLPQTGEQRMRREGEIAIVDICPSCGPGLATNSADLADALRSTAWLEADDPRLQAIAQPVARMDITEARKMEMLIERAQPYLGEINFTGHYSAVETLARRSGDCTEAAVLLAALGRAAGIPTHVAVGLTYSRQRYHGVANAFMPHAWTLAYVDGRWRSFDLALDHFESSNIALIIGDGDSSSIAAASQLASLLQFDAMAEVRAAP